MDYFFCAYPWVSLNIYHEATVNLCCNSDYKEMMNYAKNIIDKKMTLVDLKNNSIAEAVNSDTFKKIRQQMLSGEVPEICKSCFKAEKKGIVSRRMMDAEYLEYEMYNALKDTNGDGAIRNKIQRIELIFYPKCNLKCRMCFPKNSNKLIEDFNLVFDEKIPDTNTSNYNDSILNNEQFWKKIFDYSPDINRISILGGEPMILDKHWEFLEYIIKRNLSKQIRLSYNSNMTYLPEKAFKIWNEFKEIYIGLSIDDTGRRCEYLRKGLKWEELIVNLNKLTENTKNNNKYNISVTPAMTWMNVFYIDNLFKAMNEIGYNIRIYNFVSYPEFYRAWLLPEAIKLKILDKCRSLLPENEFKILESQLMNNLSNLELLNKGIFINKKFDEIRAESFREIFPELYDEIRTYCEELC